MILSNDMVDRLPNGTASTPAGCDHLKPFALEKQRHLHLQPP